MADGDIVFARFPVSTDVNGIADTVVQAGVAALFPVGVYDIISVRIVQIGGDSGIFKNVVVVVGRAIS